MVAAFDTLAAAEAMESAGLERRQARVIAAQLQTAAGASGAVARSELESALAGLRTELLDRIAESEQGLLNRIAESEQGLLNRIAESERGLLNRIAESERGLVDRIAESERRMSALLWRLFGGIVAVAGVAVAALRYLP